MSNFRCEVCNTDILEGPGGHYVTGCPHYPLETRGEPENKGETMKVTLSPPKPGYDFRDVYVDGKPVGYLGLEPGDTPGLTRCPACSKENYSMMVSSGVCYACGFDLKPLMKGASEWKPQAK